MSATVLGVTAFVLYLIMGDTPVILRVLMIAGFYAGLLVEVGCIANALGLMR